MNDGTADAFHRFKGTLNKCVARLHKHLNGYVGRDQVAFNQIPAEVEVSLRSSRKADLDFLESDLE